MKAMKDTTRDGHQNEGLFGRTKRYDHGPSCLFRTVSRLELVLGRTNNDHRLAPFLLLFDDLNFSNRLFLRTDSSYGMYERNWYIQYPSNY